MASQFEILHAVKRPTVLALDSGTNPSTVEAGMAMEVTTTGTMQLAASNSAKFVGIAQTQGYVPAYQSTGLQAAQIQGAVGSYQAGTKVSVVAGSGAVVKTDQFVNLAGMTIGDLVGCNGSGVMKTYASGDVVGILIGKDGTMGIVQMRL